MASHSSWVLLLPLMLLLCYSYSSAVDVVFNPDAGIASNHDPQREPVSCR